MNRSNLAPISLAGFALCSLSLACGGAPPNASPEAADASAAANTASSNHPGPTGSNCQAVTEAYSICTDVSLCPGISISQTQLPNCGYSIHGNVIDPECLCYGSMCPVGVPQSCADMQALLATGITSNIVCEQYASGKCSNQGNQGEPSTCQVCKNNCDGNPTCLQNCGC
jgi:hypothetical protein